MRVYLDHAATTPLDKRVLEQMMPYFTEKYANPSSTHKAGWEARLAVEDARKRVAKAINARPDQIVFTSGGTESDNLAIKGCAFKNKKGHIITSKIEHKAILKPCKALESRGFTVTYLDVDTYGQVSPESVSEAIREDTFLISIMHANNEVGTIQDIKTIGKIAAEKNIAFHTDAVQSIGKEPFDARQADMASISSHKIYGPKGVGALHIKEIECIEPLMNGGSHEFGIRAGTENVAGIVGFSYAIKYASEDLEKNSAALRRMRDTLIGCMLGKKGCSLNGHPELRLANNAHFTVPDPELIWELDRKEIFCSSGSACNSGSAGISHVLAAMGVKPGEEKGFIRMTLGKDNTPAQIKYVTDALDEVLG